MSPRRNGSKEKHFVKSQQRKTVIDNDAKYNDKKKKKIKWRFERNRRRLGQRNKNGLKDRTLF